MEIQARIEMWHNEKKDDDTRELMRMRCGDNHSLYILEIFKSLPSNASTLITGYPSGIWVLMYCLAGSTAKSILTSRPQLPHVWAHHC
jgi:hypothetical protein